MALRTLLKQMSQVFYPRTLGSFLMGQPRTIYDYAKDVGTGSNSSVVMAVVNWLMRSYPEAPLVVYQLNDEEPEIIPNHPLATLVHNPNRYYSGEQLWMATVWSWALYGNSYWRIVRTRGRDVAELWWVPPWEMEPQWPNDGSTFLSHYRYTPSTERATAIDLPVESVVHFKHGIDPHNPRLGLSPLAAVVREIWSDDEASNWVASLLRNMGIPGMIITPDGPDSYVDPEEIEKVKRHVDSRFTADGRGQAMAIGSQIKVTKLAFSPSEMDLSVVRNTSEERVTAMLGIPAAVVGFGTGLEMTKVGATMESMRRLAWENGIIPVKRIMASEVGRTLLKDYEDDPEAFEVGWDYRKVQALQEDESAKSERYVRLFQGALIMRSEGRRALGFETTPEDDVYHNPTSIVEVGPGAPEPLPQPRPPLALVPGRGDADEEDDEEAEETAAAGTAYQRKQTPEQFLHSLISRHAPRLGVPPKNLSKLITRIEQDCAAAQPRIEMLISERFVQIGVRVREVVAEIFGTKQVDLNNLVLVSHILDRLPLITFEADLAKVYRLMYDSIAEITLKSLTEMLPIDEILSRQVRDSVAFVGIDRVRTLKLRQQIRQSLLGALEEQDLTGLSEDELLKLIEERIPAGRFREVRTRARVIARSESRLSSNLTSIEHAKHHNIQHFLVFDARLGASDPECEARNGWIVTAEEAQLLASIEHPNGTYAVAGLPPATLAEAQGNAFGERF